MYQKNPLLESESFNRYVANTAKYKGEPGLVDLALKIVKKHPQPRLQNFQTRHDRKLAVIGKELERLENKAKSAKIAHKVLTRGK